MSEKGFVYIIGAGPGDPGLITVKGLRCIREADVIIYDHLVSEEILVHAKASIRLIYAGKKGGDHTLSQEEINRRLVEEARQGRTVARLKGGDPFVFGRGGEEAEVLSRAGIPFEVVPGVTSAVAVPAYAGIPLTHRGYTSTLTFVTGHEDPTKEKSDIDWQALTRMGTLVFLMGVKNLSRIVQSLIEQGKPEETPAALIRWGTTADQQTLTGTLGDIVQKAQQSRFTPPVIFVVGGVVNLRQMLNWFEDKPLFGKGVVITRPAIQSESFAELLHEQGARVIHFPTIHIAPPQSWNKLDEALEELASFQWIIFTSANGVRFFFRRLKEKGGDVREMKGIRICTIGPATADAVEALGIRVDLVPETFISEGVVRAFEKIDIRGSNILLPRAEVARDVIPRGLEKLGAGVRVADAYRTISADTDKTEFISLLKEEKVDVITFTSPSTVKGFLDIMGGDFALPERVRIAAIGPITADAAKKAGLRIDIVQDQYTIPGLVSSLVNYYKRNK